MHLHCLICNGRAQLSHKLTARRKNAGTPLLALPAGLLSHVAIKQTTSRFYRYNAIIICKLQTARVSFLPAWCRVWASC